MSGVISVAVTDDQPLLCAALRALIGNTPGFTFVAEAADGAQAVVAARTKWGVAPAPGGGKTVWFENSGYS
ncbi:hypothetical protein [Streptomyces gilvus]|uniref:hypothetical protein n=1 Tax=Streptomyces gilvus TaxID=2920937 RepID=UPI001F0EEBEF|nr:hypothetical protein [Streptomyces sp. CME 23]MCH5676249.1 hypothetical protein [Streptomyces sp. CME 23]